MFRSLIAVVLLGAVCSGVEHRENPFENDWFLSTGAGVQRRLSQLASGGFGFGRDIEEQIQDKMPPYLRDSIRRRDRQPVEAVIGGLGGGEKDETLEVLMPGEEKPKAVPSETYREFLDEIETDAEVINPQTPGVSEPVNPVSQVPQRPPKRPLFNFNFDFGPQFESMFPFGRSPFFNRGGAQPWWKGENVCVKETEVSEGEETVSPSEVSTFSFNMETKSCSDENEAYVCVTNVRRRGVNRSVTKEYRCCHGFARGTSGVCDEVDLRPMSTTLRDLSHSALLSAALSNGLSEAEIDAANLTVFAPSNQAFEDYISDIQETNDVDLTRNEVVYRRKRSHNDIDLESLVKTHLIEGIHYPSTLKDEQILPAKWSPSSVRTNIYLLPGIPPVITVNCAKVVGDPVPSQNGLVYELDRVAKPATKTIAQIISSDPQFTTLKKLMEASDLMPTLENPKGQLTLLAPTDAAFASMTEEERLTMESSSCQSAILRNHLLPNVICSAAVVSPEAKTINMLDKYLKVRLDEAGEIEIGGAKSVAKDVMAENGVIHIIDAPLIPSEAKSVISVISASPHLSEVLDLIRTAGIENEIENLAEATLFLPSNKAIKKIPHDHLQGLKADPERLRSMLLTHVTKSPLNRKSLRNNLLLDTHSGHSLRMNLYTGPLVFSLFRPSQRARITAGCSRVTLTDVRACGVQIHVVDELVEPLKGHVLDELKRHDHFSIFTKMVEDSALAEEYARPNSTLTVLAPSDHVFKTFPKKEFENLLQDKTFQEELIKRHTLREHICCSGIAPMGLFSNLARNSRGSLLPFRQTHEGLFKVGAARITHCAKPSSNGLVHTVDRLMFEPHIVDQEASKRWDSDGTRPLDFRNFFSGKFLNF